MVSDQRFLHWGINFLKNNAGFAATLRDKLYLPEKCDRHEYFGEESTVAITFWALAAVRNSH